MNDNYEDYVLYICMYVRSSSYVAKLMIACILELPRTVSEWSYGELLLSLGISPIQSQQVLQIQMEC